MAETVFRDPRWNARVGLHVAVRPTIAVCAALYGAFLPIRSPASGTDPTVVVMLVTTIATYVAVWLRARRSSVTVSGSGVVVRNPYRTTTLPLSAEVAKSPKQYTPATRCVALDYQDGAGRRRTLGLVAVPEHQADALGSAIDRARGAA